MEPEIIANSAQGESVIVGENERAVFEAVTGGKWKKYGRIAMAALGGVPWVGSILSAAATLSAENDQGQTNKLLFLWVQEHEGKLRELGITLTQIFERFESFGDRIEERIQSDEYITLVRKTFKAWDQAETFEKKEMLRRLITNAGGISISHDDLIRMFLDWIEMYHEFHFAVIREIYTAQSITRFSIWSNLRGQLPREDSAEADLFKLLVRDLSTGGVIRQERETDFQGHFKRASPAKKPSTGRSSTYESAFEVGKQYVLTELGSQFVHYVMDDLAPQLS